MDISEIEKKFAELGQELRSRFEGLSQSIEDKLAEYTGKTDYAKSPQKRVETPFWGIVFVLVGLILLGNQLGWFDLNIPLIPAALIVIGIYMILENRRKRQK